MARETEFNVEQIRLSSLGIKAVIRIFRPTIFGNSGTPGDDAEITALQQFP
ncbi:MULTISPECIES: hypothetical protein [unclassified Cupriavidus]|uniref:hypothetical protein n=1 Tax=unclassified Cupriavidus TaxID=2640874 RepID=UPI000ABC242B|nr:hypothetical protein [Cupriavidus sp. SK-3]